MARASSSRLQHDEHPLVPHDVALPVVQRQAAAVRALLSTAGFHTPFTAGPPTFRFLGFPMKLDWLFVSELEPLEWGVDRVRFTDHRGVWLRVKR